MSTSPPIKLTLGTPYECPPGSIGRRHGQWACPLVRPDGTVETTSYGADEEAAVTNASMLAASPAYLERIRPKR